jgi:hypothetical protein
MDLHGWGEIAAQLSGLASRGQWGDMPGLISDEMMEEFCVQADWMHLGEGQQLFNRMGLSVPMDSKYQERARRFAGFYMNEDPEALNYDPQHKIIKSMLNGSKGPMLRPATAIDWVGDPFDVTGFEALHGEKTFQQFLAHYQEYTNVVGDIASTWCDHLAHERLHARARRKVQEWILDTWTPGWNG